VTQGIRIIIETPEDCNCNQFWTCS